jgi:predicted alpha/beta superfamily hydrolase
MTVTGQTRLFKAVPSKFLAPTRDVIVWLPPGYDASPETRYPVLYMQDGQDIFDPKTSATGVDWGVDELLTEKIGAGQLPPMIVVGVYCTADRRPEYDPFGKGEQYAQFLINELKPMIDREFRTLDGPENTSVMGSSMGGLISLYLGWKHPEVFGRVAALSCHFHWNNAEFLNHLEATGSYPKSVKLYVDYGTRGVDVESTSPTPNALRRCCTRTAGRAARLHRLSRYSPQPQRDLLARPARHTDGVPVWEVAGGHRSLLPKPDDFADRPRPEAS